VGPPLGGRLASIPIGAQRRSRVGLYRPQGKGLSKEREGTVCDDRTVAEMASEVLLRQAKVRSDRSAEPIEGAMVVAPGARGRFRLWAGMVLANRPWKMLPASKGAIAAAFATGAHALVVPRSGCWRTRRAGRGYCC
jgi:hypothetical protein